MDGDAKPVLRAHTADTRLAQKPISNVEDEPCRFGYLSHPILDIRFSAVSSGEPIPPSSTALQ